MNRAALLTERNDDGHSNDMQFFWSLFRAPHFGVVFTDLLGNTLQLNKVAEERIFSSGEPGNFFELLGSENENDLRGLKKGQLFSDYCQFSLEIQNVCYGVYGIRQSNLSLYVWIVTITSDEKNIAGKLSLLQKNEDLAKVNAQMEKFLYSTSHDLRSPLTSILGLVNLLRFEEPTLPVLNYIDKIEASVHKLDEVINDIMRFSKNSYQRIQSEKIFLETLIWRVIQNFNGIPNARRINFEVWVEENETFYSDSERLEIIISNIIRNAVNFSDANKVKPFVIIKAKALTDDISIEIHDNGIGIGKTHLDSIFNMFYRATERSQGAGLGLYVVKEAVERLKGSIHVESEIGFGSIFKIIIPNDSKGRLVSKKIKLQKGRL